MEQFRPSQSQATDSVLSWLPDETLYSHVSRSHRLSGNASQRSSLDTLFGRGARTHHDFPSHLAHYADRHHGLLGTPVEILFKHTPLSLYLRFQDSRRADAAVQGASTAPAASTKYRLGLVGSRFGADHPLKACEQCLIDDSSRFGVAYWHLVHQIPGVFVCPSHDHPLLIAPAVTYGQLVLPHQVKFEEERSPHPDEASRLAARSLAAIVQAALMLPTEFRFDPQRLGRVLLKRCRDTSLIRPESGRLNQQALARRYLDRSRPLRVFQGMAALPTSAPEAAAQVRRVLAVTRARPHPLRFLLLIETLFESWTGFMAAYANDTAVHPATVASVANLDIEFAAPRPRNRGTPPRATVEKQRGIQRKLRPAR